MSELASLQAGFRDFLLDARPSALAAAIVADPPGAAARLAVHRNHHRLSLRAALAASYPVIARLLGDDFFADVARRYIAAAPPGQPVLSEYGADLAAHLMSDPRLEQLPWLADVARLEWLLNTALHAERHPPLRPDDLAAVPPDAAADLRLVLQPGSAVLRSAWPIDRIWLANQPPADGSGIDLAAGGVALLVLRRAEDAAFATLDAGEALFLQTLAAGSSLEHAAANAAAGSQNFSLVSALTRFTGLEIFARSM